MKRSSVVISLVLVLVSVCLVTRAQQSDEDLISQYREEVQRLTAKIPPPEAQDAYHRTLLQLRLRLRDLLVEKRGWIKKDILDLQASNRSTDYQDYLRQLGDVLQNVENEIQSLDGTLAGSRIVAVAAPVAPPAPQAAPATEASAVSEDEQAVGAAFSAKVANFSSEELAKAAAPAEVMANTTSPPLDCSLLENDATVDTVSKFDSAICRLAHNITERRSIPNSQLPPIYLQEDQASLLPIMIVKLLKTQGDASFVSFIAEADQARTDKQVGSGSATPGTTSLVVKGGVPWAFGWAVENGAATESRSDTSITFRINPVGAINVLSNTGFLTGFRRSQDDPTLNFLRKASIGMSFDTSRGNMPGTFTGDRQQLSAVSFRYEFVNERDPRNTRYQADWEQFVATQGVAFAEKMWAVTVATQKVVGPVGNREMVFKDPALQAWLEETNRILADTDKNDLTSVLRKRMDLLPVKQVSTETTQAITDFAKGFETYTNEKKRLLDKIAKGRLITFEYTNRREVNAPDISNFNFIGEGGTGRRIDWTVNASLTMFNKKPVGINITRIRDFQFAGQLDVPLGDVMGLGQSVLSFAGRYERLVADASAQTGSVMLGSKGDIGYGQLKLTVPIRGLGVKFPISVTFANRTELVKEQEVRGNFGFTFDLDTLFSRFKPF